MKNFLLPTTVFICTSLFIRRLKRNSDKPESTPVQPTVSKTSRVPSLLSEEDIQLDIHEDSPICALLVESDNECSDDLEECVEEMSVSSNVVKSTSELTQLISANDCEAASATPSKIFPEYLQSDISDSASENGSDSELMPTVVPEVHLETTEQDGIEIPSAQLGEVVHNEPPNSEPTYDHPTQNTSDIDLDTMESIESCIDADGTGNEIPGRIPLPLVDTPLVEIFSHTEKTENITPTTSFISPPQSPRLLDFEIVNAEPGQSNASISSAVTVEKEADLSPERVVDAEYLLLDCSRSTDSFSQNDDDPQIDKLVTVASFLSAPDSDVSVENTTTNEGSETIPSMADIEEFSTIDSTDSSTQARLGLARTVLPTAADEHHGEPVSVFIDNKNEVEGNAVVPELKEEANAETEQMSSFSTEESKKTVEENEQLEKETATPKNNLHESEAVVQNFVERGRTDSNPSSSSSSTSTYASSSSNRKVEEKVHLAVQEPKMKKMFSMLLRKHKTAPVGKVTDKVVPGVVEQNGLEKKSMSLRIIERIGISDENGKKLLRWRKKRDGKTPKVRIPDKVRLMMKLVNPESWKIGRQRNRTIESSK